MAVSTFIIGTDELAVYSMTDGLIRADRRIPLDVVANWAAFDPFWAARGRAIQGYASLESTLCHLMSIFGDIPFATSIEVFYKITSTGSRNAILEKLLHRKYGSDFNPFWNEYVRQLRQIDIKRNEIVHWLSAAHAFVSNEGILFVGVTLVPPTAINNPTVKLRITTQDLTKFRRQCDEFVRVASLFALRLNPPAGAAELGEPSLDTFRQPLIYPLPEGHPLFLNPEESEIHPQSLPPLLQFVRMNADGGGLVPWAPR